MRGVGERAGTPVVAAVDGGTATWGRLQRAQQGSSMLTRLLRPLPPPSCAPPPPTSRRACAPLLTASTPSGVEPLLRPGLRAQGEAGAGRRDKQTERAARRALPRAACPHTTALCCRAPLVPRAIHVLGVGAPPHAGPRRPGACQDGPTV